MQLLLIRYYQLKRDLGILFFVIIAIALGLTYFFYNHEKNYGLFQTVFIIYLLYTFHQNRTDKAFISKHFNQPKLTMVLEYQLALLPFSLSSLLTNYWYCFFIIQFAGLLMPFNDLKINSKIKHSFLTKYLKTDYILISGIRTNFFTIILFLLISLVLSPLKLFPLISLFIANQLYFSFYGFNEGIQLLRASSQSSKEFLYTLTNRHLKYSMVINGFILTINTLVNTDLFLFNLFFFLYMLISHACVIYIKYENYVPKKLQQNNQIKLLLIGTGLMFPYISALVILFYFQSKKSATSNLTNYLDD